MKHRSEGATTLLGMPGFVVSAQLEVDGEIWRHVESTAEVVGCSSCGTRAVGHGRRRVKVRDLAIAGRDVVLVWAKRLWRCADADCEVGTWSERCEDIVPRASLSERARAEIRVGAEEDSVAQAARDFGVGWHTAMAAVRDHGRPLVEDPARLEGVEALGLDETVMLHAGPRRRTTYVTGFVDLHRGRLLDIALGRSGSVVGTWLAERDENWRAGIDVVALDPFRGYANGLLAQLGHAEVVLDHFHAVRLANAAVDDVRRRVQQEVLGHRRLRAIRSMASAACCWWAPSAWANGVGPASPPAWPPGTASTRSARMDGQGAPSDPCTPPPTCSLPGGHWWRSTSGAPRCRSPNSLAWPRPSPPGSTRCSPTTPPGCPTDPPRP